MTYIDTDPPPPQPKNSYRFSLTMESLDGEKWGHCFDLLHDQNDLEKFYSTITSMARSLWHVRKEKK